MLPNVAQLPPDNSTPRHVAIIMDGNGRWARARGMPRVAGHKKGAEAVKEAMLGCERCGVKFLTLYAFSSENWKRPVEEVGGLMELLRFFLKKELDYFNQRGVNLRVIGDRSQLEKDIIADIKKAENLTKDNDKLMLTVALNYGSRQEIISAVRKTCSQALSHNLPVDEIDESLFIKNLYTSSLPELDLLIRTGGEKRLSNFLLWQSAYTELYFTDVLWPDFKATMLEEALQEFSKRERRYGAS